MNDRAFARLLVGICSLALGVSGCGSSGESTTSSTASSLERVEAGAIEKYRWFLEGNAQALVQWTTKLRGQLVAGELARAQSRYATARAQYGQVEPAAREFQSLNSQINSHLGDGSADAFIGFHRIERALFAEGTTDGMPPIAKRLLADVGRLHHELKTAVMRPVLIVEGASEAMHDVSTSKLIGEEEPYAHIDLVDVAANVEGAEAAFEAVRPLLAHEDLALTESIEAGFVNLYAILKPLGAAAREPQSRPAAAGSGFLIFTELTNAQTNELIESADDLARLLASAPNRIEQFQKAY